MTDQVTHYKMEDVQKRVSETIKAQFAMLIPDEAFEEMARAAIREFYQTEAQFTIHEIKNPTGYSPSRYDLQDRITPFKAMLWNELREITRTQLREWLKKHTANLNKSIGEIFNEEPNDMSLKALANLDVHQLSLAMARQQHAVLLQNAAEMTENRIMQLAIDNNLNVRS